MGEVIVIGAIGVVAFFILCLDVATPSFVTHPFGRIALFAGFAILPVSVGLSGLAVGIGKSSETEFCLSCHEMTDYGRTLFVDNPDALAAVHYQNRTIDRDHTCYRCHTNYALFGHVSAKFNGLKHVYVHYLGTIPEEIELYEPYPSSICLECHEDGRSYLESAGHEGELEALASGKKVCLECHDVAHDTESVAQKEFWQAK